MDIRPAVFADVPAIHALMAPEITLGNLLPRAVDPADFLVAEEDGELIGTVALSRWSEDVVELGSLVAARRGVGLGAALVEAAALEAERRGYDTVVALTAIADFFEHASFVRLGQTPWARARGCETMSEGPALDRAIATKARTCAGCARLAGCSQALLARSTRQMMWAAA